MQGKLKTQRRIASNVLGVGESRVWLDPSKFKDIKEAITRADIEGLISKGVIKKKELKGQSRARARVLHEKKRRGHRKGIGSRRGEKSARMAFEWIDKVRALRNELFKQRKQGKIDQKEFRQLYRKIKGNSFHSVNHMRNYIEGMKKA
ncbi:MAG: 50S ribosomal protein L19e [Candidatus Parvarchaeota archaeon]|nr:50S ribosomal protein L19e [Candidatus Parvarchaeum tengchongense]MCW1295068.1 50S ribosomal protein L19e [Candidatus Parvarchaeum tengchongense]MCW1299376.1 50S ribosomal protein L19e [Candidatus Parvarchaeum tengchongense]MCW1312657.1 50S ribosomal protein L19e [Candidatus Parvarchaeum tengchongense]